MVVIKNINVNVHLIDNNMYMYMMKCNIEAYRCWAIILSVYLKCILTEGEFEFEPKYQYKVIYFLALLPPPSPLSNFRIKELTGQ